MSESPSNVSEVDKDTKDTEEAERPLAGGVTSEVPSAASGRPGVPGEPPAAYSSSRLVAAADMLRRVEADQKRAVRFRTTATVVGIILVAVAGPLIYLKANGKLNPISETPLAPLLSLLRGKSGSSAKPNDPNASLTGFDSLRQQDTPAASDPVIRDLDNYITRSIPSLSTYEMAAIKDFQSVTGASSQGADAFVRVVRDKVVPEYAIYLAKASAIHPATPEVRALHQIFLNCAKQKMKAFQTIASGAKLTANVAWQKKVKSQLAAADDMDRQFQERMDDVMLKHGGGLHVSGSETK